MERRVIDDIELAGDLFRPAPAEVIRAEIASAVRKAFTAVTGMPSPSTRRSPWRRRPGPIASRLPASG
jgi:hypothetical protein